VFHKAGNRTLTDVILERRWDVGKGWTRLEQPDAMKSFWSFILYVFLACAIRPIAFLGLYLGMLAGRIRHLRIGKLNIWGDADFLRTCSSSLERLKKLDPGFYRLLTKSRVAHFVQDAKGPGGDAPPFLFLVNPAYLLWQADGIITRLIYVGYCVSSFSTHETGDKKYPNLHKEVIDKSRAWLETHQFPHELVECYGRQ
jgi:hypothetical protein